MSAEALEGYPLSTQQRSAWSRHELGFDNPLQGVILLEGPEPDVIEQALRAIIARHESLRMRLWRPPALRMPLQIVDDDVDLFIDRVDLRSVGAPDAELERLRHDLARAGDPADGPLLSLVLVRLTEDRNALVVTASRLAADSLSLGQLLVQLCDVLTGADPADATVQYADYTAWQLDARECAHADAKAHWTRVMHGGVSALPLADEGGSTGGPSRATIAVKPEQLTALETLAQLGGGTLESAVLALTAVWAWRVTRDEPLTLGLVVDAREQDEDMRGALGPYAHCLPLSIEVASDDRLEAVISAVANEESRTHELQETFAAVDIDFAHGVVFQAIDIPVPVERDDLRARLEVQADDIPPAALGVTLVRSGDESRLELQSAPGCMSQAALDTVAGQLDALLDAAIADPNMYVSQLTLGAPGDAAEMPLAILDGGPSAAPEGTIHELIAARASEYPERTAVISAAERLSFAELNDRANRLAHVLRERGTKPGDLVGVCVERSADMVVALLGALKAGATYVPLDPSTLNPGHPGYPQERLAFMLEDTSAQIVLTHTELAGRLPELSATELTVDAELLAGAPSDNPDVEVTPDSIAYAIYTSGSTGRPKAVTITHGAIMNLWGALRRDVYGSRSDRSLRVSLNAPLGFDPSVQQLLSLVEGHTIVIVPEEIRADGRSLLDFIESHQIDVWDCTPPQLRLLIAAGLLDDGRLGPELILCGGEAIDEGTWRAVVASGSAEVFNVYGPTECAVVSTFARFEGPQPTIGSPIAGARVYLLDDAREPVPAGVAGELWIAGAGVGQGYLARPELTAERFVADPFADDGARMYRTGDLGRLGSDGAIEFLGRVDDQVKIRSHRIELGEVASVLAQSPSVREAVVIVRADGDSEPRLVAYYVPAEGQKPTTSDLRAHLKEWLPEYMLPSAFVDLEAMPLTRNGKIDRRRLPVATRSRPLLNVEFVEPRDELERAFAEIWGRVLDLDAEEVGIRDNFFDDLGGDSLKAIDLVNQVEALIGRELPLDFVVQASCIDEQAARLRDEVAAVS